MATDTREIVTGAEAELVRLFRAMSEAERAAALEAMRKEVGQ